MVSTNPFSNRGNQRTPNTRTGDGLFTLLQITLVCAAFYLGIQSGKSATGPQIETNCNPSSKNWEFDQVEIDKHVKARIDVALSNNKIEAKTLEREINRSVSKTKVSRFDRKTSKFATGISKVTKKEFIEKFDYGLPENYDEKGNEEVIILYNDLKSLPSNDERREAVQFDHGIGIPLMGAHEATENCDAMNVFITHAPKSQKHCIAVVGNYESYHAQKWMRIGTEGTKKGLNSVNPLIHVGRGMQTNGVDQFEPPDESHIKKHWQLLKAYLNNLQETLDKLKPIVSKAAKQNTVVVMVCNLGQSALLQNFICAARSKSIDISNVVIFATDPETLKIAQGLGLAAFYDDKNFASLPSTEAGSYGDATFVAMMYAKVVSVQLVNMLGYDLLFQDVDIVWYKDPLVLFHDQNSELYDYDIMFQDDGARSVRYAPYCANSGFYYVRHNDRTRYLLSSLLYSGDLIMKTRSHQAALNALIIEHSSLYNLKVKTLPGEDFPGGFHFHRRKELMQDIVSNKANPWIFHMSWTKNKDNKLLFLQQMGLWHLNDQCYDDKALTVFEKNGGSSSSYLKECCSMEARTSCHYSDKPSVIPCNDSPPIDKGGKPFWPK